MVRKIGGYSSDCIPVQARLFFKFWTWKLGTSNRQRLGTLSTIKFWTNSKSQHVFSCCSPLLRDPQNQIVQGNLRVSQMETLRTTNKPHTADLFSTCISSKKTSPPKSSLPAVVKMEQTRWRNSIRRTGRGKVCGWDGDVTLAPASLAQPRLLP